MEISNVKNIRPIVIDENEIEDRSLFDNSRRNDETIQKVRSMFKVYTKD